MNNISDIRVDVKDPETGYGELATVVGEVTKIVKKADGYNLVAITDFTGKEIVALIRGRSKPGDDVVGKVGVFKLSAERKDGEIKYSGFYNARDDIPQQYAGKRPPHAKSSSAGGGAGYDAPGKNRGFALAYAKDLVVAGVITMKQIGVTTMTFAGYLDTGNWPVKREPEPEPEPEIPEYEEYEDNGYDDRTAPETEYAPPIKDEDNPF